MTGLESFDNPAEITAIYPFPGFEWLLVLVVVVLWVLWHVAQTRAENREYREAQDHYDRIGLERATHHGGSADIADEEEVAAEQARTSDAAPPTAEAPR